MTFILLGIMAIVVTRIDMGTAQGSDMGAAQEYACNDSGWFWADGKQKIIKEDCSECNQDYAPYVMSLPATIMASVRKASCNRAIENGKCEFDCTTEMCKNVNRIEENLCNDSGWFWNTKKGKTFEKDCSECNECYASDVKKSENIASINRQACNRAIANGKCEFDDTTKLCKNVEAA